MYSEAMELPVEFVVSMRELIGNAECSHLTAALSAEPTVSIRPNEAKCCMHPHVFDLSEAERVPWSRSGVYLYGRPRFTFDPLLHAGLYYVEEPSSMFVEQAFLRIAQDIRPRRVLDLCASPGGKSTLLRSIMDDEALLVSNDPIPKRAAVLAENICKWGHPNVAVTCDLPEQFARLESFFDVIIADVPCSGEGMFRKDLQARGEWSVQAVKACACRQRDIIRDVWSSLREGGFLIYSTCTFNRDEDEDNVRWIADTLGAETVPIPMHFDWNICGDVTGANAHVYHFFPHKTKGEGFFLALLRKKGRTPQHTAYNAAARKSNDNDTAFAAYAEWLDNTEVFNFRKIGATIYARHRSLAADFDTLHEHLGVIFAGIPVAEEKTGRTKRGNTARAAKKGDTNVPHAPTPALALSTKLRRGAFPEYEAEYPDAIKFLRGETLLSPPQNTRGVTLVTYRDVPLGFANNVGTRLNNAYPQPWRIRSTYVPAVPPVFEF